jgi:hypothetical protein
MDDHFLSYIAYISAKRPICATSRPNPISVLHLISHAPCRRSYSKSTFAVGIDFIMLIVAERQMTIPSSDTSPKSCTIENKHIERVQRSRLGEERILRCIQITYVDRLGDLGATVTRFSDLPRYGTFLESHQREARNTNLRCGFLVASQYRPNFRVILDLSWVSGRAVLLRKT